MDVSCFTYKTEGSMTPTKPKKRANKIQDQKDKAMAEFMDLVSKLLPSDLHQMCSWIEQRASKALDEAEDRLVNAKVLSKDDDVEIATRWKEREARIRRDIGVWRKIISILKPLEQYAMVFDAEAFAVYVAEKNGAGQEKPKSVDAEVKDRSE
jgi:hypothetical protein